MFSQLTFIALAALHVSLTQSATIPSGAITIGKSGSGATYSTITAGLADTSSSIYYIYAGNYTESVVLTRAGVSIYGATSNTYSYASNTVTISHSLSAAAAGSDDASGTVRVTKTATGVSVQYQHREHIRSGSPGNRARRCSHELCLLRLPAAWLPRYVTGSIWITESTITTVGNGCITASGRSTDDATYYVINDSTITSTSHTNYLGRPWRDYARVIFQNSYLGSNIAAAGWEEWSSTTPNIDHITFGEYNNTGPGAWGSSRASFATKLTAPIAITTVLGSTSWIDSTWMAGTATTTTTTTKATTTTTTTKATTTTTTKTSTTTTATSTSTGTVTEYGQCGGTGYTGATVCVSPYVCTYQNDFYSQCL
ncbi:hypothetical protein FRB94_011913 [Tulasnella sp. JGI-2019a]|nr:hypothetical protein FRB94_011913 [Tulasnella sp. JGI-2019a]